MSYHRNQPSWWRTAEQQLDRAHKLWPSKALPVPPSTFDAQTDTEVLLLHVPDTFTSLWSKVGGHRPPSDFKPKTERPFSDTTRIYGPWAEDGRAATVRFMRMIGMSLPYKTSFDWKRSGWSRTSKPLPIDLDNDPAVILRAHVPLHSTPVWLAFDPENRKDTYDDSAPDKSYPAASEVFSALIQFPDWPFSWFDGASAPNIEGYARLTGVSPIGQEFWDDVPYLDRWDDAGMLVLSFKKPDFSEKDWAKPRIREC